MCSYQEKKWLFFVVLKLQTAIGNFPMFYQIVLLSNITFLISKQNKTPKLTQKCLSSRLVLLFLDMPYLLHKQTELYN